MWYKQSSVGGTYHLGKGGIREGDTDSDNVKAGVEELLSPVWRRRARVVLRRLGGGVELGEAFIKFYNDFLILLNTNGMKGCYIM